MAKDASFEKIEAIKPHPNADKLELATICGWQVVVGKGEFKVGDVVFYIREDAKLLGFDHRSSYDGSCTRWPWQTKLLPYLGSSGRVKTVKLRGEFSCGIAVSLAALFGHINKPEAKDWEKDNIILNGEFPGGLLSGKYGVTHWEAPIRNVGDLKARGGLPYSIPKSDEANIQELRDIDKLYGTDVLVTRKLDGTSTTIIAFPDGRYHVCTRSNDLQLDCDNVWNRAAKPVVPLAQAWAKAYNKPIVLRGETCAQSMQKFAFNKDKDVPEPTFNLYGVIHLDETDADKRYGTFGTEYHFLKVAEQIKAFTGKEIKTVPILGVRTFNRELVDEYLNWPLENGEGVVINAPIHDYETTYEFEGEIKHGVGHSPRHFKIKSLAYLAALSKKA